MRCLPEPATPRGRWGRTRCVLAAVAAAVLVVQLVPIVHTVLVVLVATSWTLIGLLAARALARRHGLHLPAWASPAAAARTATRLVGRLAGQLAGWLLTPRRSTPAATPVAVATPVTAGQDCYELVGGPMGGQR